MKRYGRLLRLNANTDSRFRESVYEAEVIKRIRTRYTIDQELAILRQRDTKPEEFAAYNAFAEACKAEVDAELS